MVQNVCQASLKLVQNEFLFLCPDSTLAITAQVYELEEQCGVGVALNVDELLATEVIDGESEEDELTPIHPHTRTPIVHTTNKYRSVCQTTVPKVTPLSLNRYFLLIVQWITLSNWG